MDERWDIDRDGDMGNDTGMRSHRHVLGILAALVAVLLLPMTAPSAAAVPEQPATSTMESGSPIAAVDVEAPSDAALRTSGTLAAIVAGAGAVVGVWWYLVVRRRRD